LVDTPDTDAEDAATVIVFDDAGDIVAPHVQIDTHVQTDEHVHENAGACVQDATVASESEGTAPGGNERIRGDADGCAEDNVESCEEDSVESCKEDTIESCDEVEGDIDEDVARDVEKHGVDDDDEGDTSDDGEDNARGITKDAGDGWATDAAVFVMLCVGGGAGGGPLGNAPEVAFLMMSAACSNVSVRMTKAACTDLTFSAMPYTTAWRWLAGMTGMMDASTSLRFWVP
jgi:hypothetical protein